MATLVLAHLPDGMSVIASAVRRHGESEFDLQGTFNVVGAGGTEIQITLVGPPLTTAISGFEIENDTHTAGVRILRALSADYHLLVRVNGDPPLEMKALVAGLAILP